MKKSRFTESQIVAVLKEEEAGVEINGLTMKHGISRTTYFNWRSKYSGGTSSARAEPTALLSSAKAGNSEALARSSGPQCDPMLKVMASSNCDYLSDQAVTNPSSACTNIFGYTNIIFLELFVSVLIVSAGNPRMQKATLTLFPISGVWLSICKMMSKVSSVEKPA
ncbi:MAG: transposase [Steroidobacteraceae bacterium]